MPWKGEENPYFIWLSEIILQQTRVQQGLPYYNRFIKKYPDVSALAVAKDEEVFKLWEGLGYYSRCRNLLKTARIVTVDYKGRFPADYDLLLKLPGIGPYTAAAIASFAFGLPEAVVDGNVYRVLSRYFGMEVPMDSTQGKKIFSEKAYQLLSQKYPAAYNQAIMDFGATVCTPKKPLCGKCILSKECFALINNQIAVLPVKEKRMSKSTRYFYYAVIKCKNEVLISQRNDKDIWQNLFEFFLAESDEPREDAAGWVAEKFMQLSGTSIELKAVSDVYKQTLTHRRIEGQFVQFKVEKKVKIKGYDWIKLEELHKYAFPIFIQQYAGKDLKNLM